MAYDRLRERGRKEESGVPMQFIEVILKTLMKGFNCFFQGLHQSYEDWLIHQSQVIKKNYDVFFYRTNMRTLAVWH